MIIKSKNTAEIFFDLIQYKNGIISKSMIEKGIFYEKNFGVSVFHIKQVAKKYFPDHNLALELFERKERECKLAAIFIDKPEYVTKKQIEQWSKHFTNTEITEQTCLNLFAKTPLGKQKITEWGISENKFLQQAAWNIIEKTQTAEPDFLNKILSKINSDFSDTNVQFAAIKALYKFAKNNQTQKNGILQFAQSLTTNNNENKQFVGREIVAFITSEKTK